MSRNVPDQSKPHLYMKGGVWWYISTRPQCSKTLIDRARHFCAVMNDRRQYQLHVKAHQK